MVSRCAGLALRRPARQPPSPCSRAAILQTNLILRWFSVGILCVSYYQASFQSSKSATFRWSGNRADLSFQALPARSFARAELTVGNQPNCAIIRSGPDGSCTGDKECCPCSAISGWRCRRTPPLLPERQSLLRLFQAQRTVALVWVVKAELRSAPARSWWHKRHAAG